MPFSKSFPKKSATSPYPQWEEVVLTDAEEQEAVALTRSEKIIFSIFFFINFSPTITQSFITRFTCMPNIVQDGECVNPVKFLYQTDEKKNARSKLTFFYVRNSA